MERSAASSGSHRHRRRGAGGEDLHLPLRSRPLVPVSSRSVRDAGAARGRRPAVAHLYAVVVAVAPLLDRGDGEGAGGQRRHALDVPASADRRAHPRLWSGGAVHACRASRRALSVPVGGIGHHPDDVDAALDGRLRARQRRCVRHGRAAAGGSHLPPRAGIARPADAEPVACDAGARHAAGRDVERASRPAGCGAAGDAGARPPLARGVLLRPGYVHGARR